MPLSWDYVEPEVGFEPTTFRLRVGCSASIWTAPDGSSLLTLGALSVQTAPDGYKRIVWMIKRMIKGIRQRIDAKASKGVAGLTDDQGPSDTKSDGKASRRRGLTVCGEAATLGALGLARYG